MRVSCVVAYWTRTRGVMSSNSDRVKKKFHAAAVLSSHNALLFQSYVFSENV
jgi:hypothetical protein